jgi:hypothetical protein
MLTDSGLLLATSLQAAFSLAMDSCTFNIHQTQTFVTSLVRSQ